MKYKELFKTENEEIKERYELAMERISLIPKENAVDSKFTDYFLKSAQYILMIRKLVENLNNDEYFNYSFEDLMELNKKLYNDLIGEKYNTSYSNPTYCIEKTENEYGEILCYLYTELKGMVSYAYEFRLTDITIFSELFIQIYNCFENEINPPVEELKSIIYWFNSDYSDIFIEFRTREQFDPELSFATDIIMNSDLTDLRYLYKFGEYISKNEIMTAKYLNSLSLDKINTMANAMSEGYRIGFILGNKDLSNKRLVVIQYNIGFERVIREVIKNFQKLNLKTIIYRNPVKSLNKRGSSRAGFFATSPNRQYDYDHKDDCSLYFDKQFSERKLCVLQNAYEKYKHLANAYAGPAVFETFGEKPFEPIYKPEALNFNEKQQKLNVEYMNKAKMLLNNYVKMDEISFTIIAFPVYEIGEKFEEIFDETIKLNTLDYMLYRNIQQNIIDVLDKAEYIEVKGCGDNCTNITINLCSLNDSEKETKFENCVADVNIPVGEVFTSPKLINTSGVLHVTKVFLNGLLFNNLKISFNNGMITDYTCSNFESEADNKKYIKENILYNHDSLPMGEFAIGTNTTAYVMAEKYKIADKLPILIAEKTGPHFAVGDTCYSYSEDVKVYNPDQKEIVCRDNEITAANRKASPEKAYFNCHTDITIPYSELGSINAVMANGSIQKIIENGRFVLDGTEELNKPFKK